MSPEPLNPEPQHLQQIIALPQFAIDSDADLLQPSTKNFLPDFFLD